MIKNEINQALIGNNIDFIENFICNDPDWLIRYLGISLARPLGRDLPIHYATRLNYIGLVRLFLEKNPDLLNVPGNGDLTPLMAACAWGQVEIVQYLISQNAALFYKINNSEDKENHGKAAFHYAIEFEEFDIADLLLSAMIDHSDEKAVVDF